MYNVVFSLAEMFLLDTMPFLSISKAVVAKTKAHSRNNLNMIYDNKQSCLTPISTLNRSVS